MTAPRRIQRKRTKGWRMPAGVKYVGRGSRYGNHYVVGKVACDCRSPGECSHNTFRCETAAEAAREYRAVPRSEKWKHRAREDLRGRDLACWCGLCDAHRDGKPLGVRCEACAPCHADVLLEIANEPEAAR